MGLDDAALRERLVEFGMSRDRGRTYFRVPVCGPVMGWPDGSPVHEVDGIWVDSIGSGEVLDWSPLTHEQLVRDVATNVAVLITARTNADRTGLGMLIAGRELFSRAVHQHSRLDGLCITDRLRGMSVAYLAEGFAIVSADGSDLEPPTRRGPRWHPERAVPSGEDRSIHRYYEELCGGLGTLWQEVPISDAALDGLLISERDGERCWWPSSDPPDLAEIMKRFDVEVIEAKNKLTTDVIGQVVAGATLLMHSFPDHRLVRQVIVVRGEHDAALEWVCAKRGIRVARFD